jgi:hypothetical protein
MAKSIYSYHVADYVFENHILKNKELSNTELRNEYDKILDYLLIEIKVHVTNIINHHTIGFISYKRPVLIDGDLGFQDIVGGRFIVDRKMDKEFEIANITLGNEISLLYLSYFTFNQFVDYWYEITGEIIREKIDIEKENEALKTIRENKLPANLLPTVRQLTDTIDVITRYNEPVVFPLDVLTDTGGNPYGIPDLKGRYTLVTLGASWNPSFQKITSDLQELYERHGDADFSFLIIFLNETPESIELFIKLRDLTVPVAFDIENKLRNDYSPHIPTTYFVDPAGNILIRIENAQDWVNENTLRFFRNNMTVPRGAQLPGRAAHDKERPGPNTERDTRRRSTVEHGHGGAVPVAWGGIRKVSDDNRSPLAPISVEVTQDGSGNYQFKLGLGVITNWLGDIAKPIIERRDDPSGTFRNEEIANSPVKDWLDKAIKDYGPLSTWDSQIHNEGKGNIKTLCGKPVGKAGCY